MSADRLAEAPTNARTPSRKEEENKAIVDRWLTNFWGKSYNPAIVDELTERNVFLGHSLYTPRSGPASLKTFMAELREAFPDFSVEKMADLVAEGNTVIVRWVCEGTHTGAAVYGLVMGALPDASGRKMRFTGMSAIRLEAGKIIKEIVLTDGVTALNQLGFIRVPVWPA